MRSGIVPTLVLGLGILLAAGVLIPLATGSRADYADLVPAPDTIVWEVGDETTLWLSTNRHAVDLRVDNVALGLGDIRQRDAESGGVTNLGHGGGCEDWVVKSLEADSITSSRATVEGTVDRGQQSGSLSVHMRGYQTSAGSGSATAFTSNAGADATFSYNFGNLASGVEYRVDASSNEHFPVATTRSVTVTPGDAESGTSDSAEEETHMLENTGQGLISCFEEEEVLVTLHGDKGEELNRYLVDVLPAPTPAAPPVFTAGGYTTRRVCVDTPFAEADTAATNRARYLSSDEKVGAAVTATDANSDTVSYDLGIEDPNDYYLFFEVDSLGQITVNDGGANDHSGLDADRVYPVVLTASDGNGGLDRVTVAVQLDAATESPSDDGLCS